MRVTRLQDIADKLNITKVAVSKALRDHPDISVDLKARVRSLAKSMGYVPNNLAKNLKARKTNTIGVVVPNITNSFFAHIVNGIISFCSDNNYSTLVTISNENPKLEKININNLLSLQVDGLLICITHNSDSAKIFDAYENAHVPFVFFDRIPQGKNIYAISSDQTKAAFDATKYLLSIGYSRIAFINGPENLDISKKRIKGYLKALQESNMKIDLELIKNITLNKIEGEKVVTQMFSENIFPEMFFCINDQVAAGVYRAIYNKGLKIPDDIGVLAFGHQEFANSLTPALTLIEQYPEYLGNKAASYLIDVISDKSNPKNLKYCKTSLINGQSIISKEKLINKFTKL